MRVQDRIFGAFRLETRDRTHDVRLAVHPAGYTCIRVEDRIFVAFRPQASSCVLNLQACGAFRQLRMHTRPGLHI